MELVKAALIVVLIGLIGTPFVVLMFKYMDWWERKIEGRKRKKEEIKGRDNETE